MRIAICTRDPREQDILSKWIGQYCQVYGRACSLFPTKDPEVLFEEGQSFQIVFLGLGGRDGFLMARRLRDADRKCRVVLIDDTSEFAVSGVRIHLSDYIVRPVDFKKTARAMKLALAGGDL